MSFMEPVSARTHTEADVLFPFTTRLLPPLVLLLLPTAAFCGSPALQLKGTFQPGGMVLGKTSPGTTVIFRGQPLRVSENGAFLLGFGRDDQGEAELTLVSDSGEKRTEVLRIPPRDYPTQRIEGLPERLVTPLPRDLADILLDRIMVREARSHESALSGFRSAFQWPVDGRISSVYGSQRILNGEPRQPHLGVDIAAPAGTTVRAPAPGRVRLIAEDLFFSGKTLVVDHGHGLSSSYLHLREVMVEEGTLLRQGQPMAKVGSTGRVTGAHLDWRLTLFGCSLDPVLVAEGNPDR
ncbi:M23 family metallopeptidase [Thiohalorhabdus sp. Cl-TMA]|uniref:M23 family metallopeptidase n=1 Tax=Thiohalorhabdus methylotrophus TaxID=3242694 RepID=A0ABV4TXQ2_9GAMM